MIRVLDELLFFALRERATDIHIEPQEIQSRIRFRVDGMMRTVMQFPRRLHRALVTRLKIVSSLNIAESRFPADGRFSLAIGTAKADFRFSSLPASTARRSSSASSPAPAASRP
jgi:type IV pilus assembly protein PilB